MLSCINDVADPGAFQRNLKSRCFVAKEARFCYVDEVIGRLKVLRKKILSQGTSWRQSSSAYIGEESAYDPIRDVLLVRPSGWQQKAGHLVLDPPFSLKPNDVASLRAFACGEVQSRE